MTNDKPRVSPTVEGYTAESARITESEREKQLTELEKINRERAINEKEIIAQGSFYIAKSGISQKICAVLAALAMLLEVFFLITYISFLPSSLITATYPVLFITLGYIVIMTPIMVYLRSGNEYKYSANLREFSFSRRDGKGAVAHFFYKDVLSVDYCPHKFLWFDNGYYVTIETKSGFFTYKYVFPRFRHWISAEKLPFEVIREQIAESKNLPEQQSVRLGLSKKKTAAQLAIIAAVCAFCIILPTAIYLQPQYIVALVVFAIFIVIPCIRQILKGEPYRYRSDNQEFVLRQANGEGKTTRIRFSEVQDIVYKRRLFGAAAVIKTKDKTLKFRYIYPKPFQMKLLCETPFAVFAERNGETNEH